MKLALLVSTSPSERWDLARQTGVTHAVTRLPNPGDEYRPWEREPLRRIKAALEDAGLERAVVEGRPPMKRAMLGAEERDEEIEYVRTLLRNMGELDVPVWCWDWMKHHGAIRTSDPRQSTPAQGSALVSSYDHELASEEPDLEVAPVSEAELWENVEYFFECVVPVAEEAGVTLALHPDDPPLSPIQGVSGIFTSVDAFDWLLALYESDCNKVSLCQGNFALMDTPIPEAIRHFDGDIAFVHYRDVMGTPEQFRETFHDSGQTDMYAALRGYWEIGYDDPIRPDHFPTMAGEEGAGGAGARTPSAT